MSFGQFLEPRELAVRIADEKSKRFGTRNSYVLFEYLHDVRTMEKLQYHFAIYSRRIFRLYFNARTSKEIETTCLKFCREYAIAFGKVNIDFHSNVLVIRYVLLFSLHCFNYHR